MKSLMVWLKTGRRGISIMVCLFGLSLVLDGLASSRPSEFLWFLTGICSITAIVMCGKIMPTSMADGVDKGIFVLSCTAGGMFNMVAKIANDGYMPVMGLTVTDKCWKPMTGARLTWLGDWLPGNFSIGDVLVIAGLLWITYCVIKWRVQRTRAEQPA